MSVEWSSAAKERRKRRRQAEERRWARMAGPVEVRGGVGVSPTGPSGQRPERSGGR